MTVGRLLSRAAAVSHPAAAAQPDRRTADEYDGYRDGCGRCHGTRGLMDWLVVVGVGLRPLHADCAERLRRMGYEVREERRKGH